MKVKILLKAPKTKVSEETFPKKVAYYLICCHKLNHAIAKRNVKAKLEENMSRIIIIAITRVECI